MALLFHFAIVSMHILHASPDEEIQALHQNSYFSTLSEPVLKSLADGTSLRLYAHGEMLSWQGEPCIGLFIIRQGSVKLFKLSSKGRQLIIRVLEEGATFNEVPVIDLGPNPVNVAALEDSRIWVVYAVVIRSAIANHPEMAQAVILNLSKNLRTLVNSLEELSFFQVTNRLARLINRMPPEQLREQSFTQDYLAAHLGTVREVIARSLRDLERSGAIRIQHKKIQVLDEQVLKDWALEPCDE